MVVAAIIITATSNMMLPTIMARDPPALPMLVHPLAQLLSSLARSGLSVVDFSDETGLTLVETCLGPSSSVAE